MPESIYINEVHIRGKVSNVKVLNAAGVARFVVSTEYYFGGAGGRVVDITYFHVESLTDRPVPKDGQVAEVWGRTRAQRYTNSEGEECTYSYIIAKDIKVYDV